MIYEKWRDLSINLFDIKFNNIKLKEIISYPPAGNDVVEAICLIDGKEQNVFIKYERSKMADFISETNNLKILKNNNYYDKIPVIYEDGIYNDKQYIVISKIEGNRLSDILKESNEFKEEYLFKYGSEFARIHSIQSNKFKIAKQRIINDYPTKENYNNFDEFIIKYIDYLETNKPEIKYDTFIHGDFHYANVLWNNKCISGIIDFEYSGLGFKEQDIAWAIILRPGQYFMDNKKDIITFLDGYSSISDYNKDKLKWCLINGYCHFYLMNINNEEYKNKLKKLIKFIYED